MLPLLFFLLLDPIALPEKPVVVSAEPLPELDAKFRHTEGWVGGDGAYSVSFSEKRTLWLFSDTWIGSVREGKRRDVVMVNNSIGIQQGSGNEARFSFPLVRSDTGKARAVFMPPDGRGWFWIYAGIASQDKLHAFLPRFEKTSDPGAFGFRGVDLWLGTVGNPNDPPAQWKTDYAKVPFAHFTAESKQLYGSSLLQVKDRIYIYGYEEKPGRPFPSRRLLVARAPAGRLADFSAWQFFASGDWKPSADSACAQCDNLATEFSVSFVPGLDRYMLITTENGLSDRIVGRFSATPSGPWSDPVLLYTCPEMKKSKKVFSYAAKAHPHLAGGNELVISYVVNSFDLGTVLGDAELYWPRFVRVKLK